MDYIYFPIAFSFYNPFGTPNPTVTSAVTYDGTNETGGADPLPSYSLIGGQTVSAIEVLVWTEFGKVRTLIDNITIIDGTTPISGATNGYVLYNNSGVVGAATVTTLLGYTAENVTNKATGFGTLNNTLYATTQAIATYVAAQIAAIPSGVSLATLDTTLANFVTDFTTGLGYTSATGLVVTIASGTASIGGQYTAFAGGTITITGTKDNWIYLKNDGTLQFIAVTINASQPATPAGQIVIWKVTTNSSAVTAHADERNLYPFSFGQISGFTITIGTTTITSGTNGYVLYNNSGVIGNATIPTILGFTPENVANKATSFGTLNNTLYPTTSAVNTKINSAISAALTPYQAIQKTVTNVNNGMSPYTVLSTDQILNVDVTAGTVALVLPTPAAGNAGQSWYVLVGTGDVTSHNITLTATGGANIKGSGTYTMATANKDLSVISNGTLYTGQYS